MLSQVIDIARVAGSEVMRIYHEGDYDVQLKDGDSPVTRADHAAHQIITKHLAIISDLPIISEEGERAKAKDTFWLVDPLDGTKEFISKNGEFTVNIALVKQGKPVLGVVYAPVLGEVYAAEKGKGAFKESWNKKRPIRAEFGKGQPKVVTSRNHKDKETAKLLACIGPHQEVSMGSSLKLCLVAEGSAMFYPRLAPTYGWDTAAADAIVREAGGFVEDLGGSSLIYSPGAVKNPFFIARTKDSTPLAIH